MYDVESLVRDPSLLRRLLHSVETDGPPPVLRSAKLKLTARCNLKCQMCRFGRGWTPPELPEERFRGVLDELAALECRKVHFSGGEVFVRRDFERLVAHASSLDMKVTMTTNLTLVNRERAKALMRSKISSISTSVDGASARAHDRVRGIPGSFKRTLRALGWLQDERERRGQRTRFRINFTLLRQNYREYPGVVRLAAEHGAVDVLAMPVDDLSERSTVRLKRRQIEEYNTEIAPAVLEARRAAGMSTDAAFVYPFGRSDEAVLESSSGRYSARYYEQNVCYAPYSHIFIAWDGEVFACCMTDGSIEPLGDVSKQTVAEVFHGDAYRRLRSEMRRVRLADCHRCDMFLSENRVIEAAKRRLPLVDTAPSLMAKTAAGPT